MSLWKSNWAKIASLGLGIGLIAAFIAKLGWHNIVYYLAEMKIEFVLILLIACGWYLCQSLAWEQFLEARKSKISLWQLLQIKIAGEAVNSATPVSWAGGDPLRIALMRRFLPGSEGAASVVLDRTICSLTAAVMMGIGVGLALITLNVPEPLRFGLSLVITVIGISITITIYNQHRGLFSGFLYILDALGAAKWVSAGTREKLAMTDAQIQYFYQSGRLHFYLSISLHATGRLLGVLEIYAIAAFLDIPLSVLHAYYLAMLSALINMLFVFIPGSMGIMEGAYGALFHLIALKPAAGVAVQLVRRIRSFFWIAIGFFFIFLHQRHSHGDPK